MMRTGRFANSIIALILIAMISGIGYAGVRALHSRFNQTLAVPSIIVLGQSILPPDEAQKSHPLAKQIESVMQRQAGMTDFVPTGLKKDDYLRIVDGQVKVMRTYQNDEGRIIDPVLKREFAYTTPCYAHAVATIAASGFNTDQALLASGRKAMDVAIADMVVGKCADNHGDFYTYPVMLAMEQFQKVLPAGQIMGWRKQLAGINPAKVYHAYNRAGNNWGIVNAGGEFLRFIHGLTSPAYIDNMLQIQQNHFTSQGLYQESGNPFAYDAFSRYYLTGMLHRGYHGPSFEFYRDMLWKGAWTSLLIQSPFGELPTCFRSAHHIWNEAELAKTYEVYAAHYAKAGRMAEAGAFKRGARLALQSISSWIRPDGSGYIVKNRYPIEAQHGYERYSAHACYTMLACSMLCAAWSYADDSIEEKPAPADLGGFVIHIPEFNMVVANAGGTYVQYMTRGNQKYNPTGIIRIHFKNGHPQLGPSEGVVNIDNEKDFKALSVGPAWKNRKGDWVALAEFPGSGEADGGEKKVGQVSVRKEKPDLVAFDVTFNWRDVAVTEKLRLGAEGLRVEDELIGKNVAAMRVYYPMLVFNGLKETGINISDSRATLEMDGRGVQYKIIEPVDTRLERLGRRLKSRNGMVEPLYADVKGMKASYFIRSIENNPTVLPKGSCIHLPAASR
jgi:hypothetical protein